MKSTFVSIPTVRAMVAALKSILSSQGNWVCLQTILWQWPAQAQRAQCTSSQAFLKGTQWKNEGQRGDHGGSRSSIIQATAQTLIQVIPSSWESSSSVYTSQPQETNCSWPLGWLSGQTKSTHWIHVSTYRYHSMVSLHHQPTTPLVSVLPSLSLWSLTHFSAEGLNAEAPVLQHTWQGTLHHGALQHCSDAFRGERGHRLPILQPQQTFVL